MEKSYKAFQLVRTALSDKAALEGTIKVTFRSTGLNCQAAFHGNNAGHLIAAWNTLNALVDNHTTDCTMDELIGALDILNELMEQTQTQTQTQTEED